MRSTQASDLARVHSVSWHLMRRKPLSSPGKRYSQTYIGKQGQLFELSQARLAAQVAAIRAGTFVSDV